MIDFSKNKQSKNEGIRRTKKQKTRNHTCSSQFLRRCTWSNHREHLVQRLPLFHNTQVNTNRDYIHPGRKNKERHSHDSQKSQNASFQQKSIKNYWKNNPNNIILATGKGNATVILNIQKTKNLLESIESRINEKDPTTHIEKKTKRVAKINKKKHYSFPTLAQLEHLLFAQ